MKDKLIKDSIEVGQSKDKIAYKHIPTNRFFTKNKENNEQNINKE